jgi:hypothetical protein
VDWAGGKEKGTGPLGHARGEGKERKKREGRWWAARPGRGTDRPEWAGPCGRKGRKREGRLG